ncbi:MULTISPECIES: hypothetical protein [Sutcliffiella]|uniref:Uncharacterized protein n=1 Tax=Sutcliffiella cohnii TaxID=33932 RepID=A0A223KMR9_9BACI|nr:MULTISPECIES: hypothetical protein [Sutcliffiella]AST90654.1 hypothetical protein BC6307_04835 [Sutcliffiella cohnii]MED4016942.1 hypothetical protein [Sutcliffiella cohnii]WBL16306.1 hypothetical protein O1A01_06650 [Sutcliffiella sp. NC1]
MSHKGKETVCIRTKKVYDWVTRQVDVPLISLNNGELDEAFVCKLRGTGNFCDLLAENDIDVDTLSVNCFLSDAHGNRIDPKVDHKALLCQEIKQPGGRHDVDVTLPNGDEITLQKVKVLVKGHVVVELVDAVGNVVCRTCPIQWATAQTFILCAPEGTKLSCHISFFECDASLICTDEFNQLDVSIVLCLEVQMEANVKLEIEARICRPREEILEAVLCPVEKFPPQCPEIFPSTH